MNAGILDNALFRNIYCNLVNESTECTIRGYEIGFLSEGFAWLAFSITAFAISFLFVNGILMSVLALIWGERRLLARFQNRVGPNRWGPFGILTPVADAVKTLFKEDIIPDEADRFLFNLAPIIMIIPVFLIFAVIPIGFGTFVVDLNIGLLFVIAVTGMTGIAVVTAAWASANRIAIFSALRAVAMFISYEIPMALSLLGVVILAGSLSMVDIVQSQHIPFIIVQPLGFLVFFLASLAEMGRTPFDLVEAESELAAGHLNDYSSMKFGILFMAEWAAAIAGSAIMVTVFLSGWRGWEFIPSHLWFAVKVTGVLFVIIWVRYSWPRLRIDQVLELAWKGLFELTLINLIVTAVLAVIMSDREPNGVIFSSSELWIMAAVNWAVFFPSIYLIGKLLGTPPYEDPIPDNPDAIYAIGKKNEEGKKGIKS